jgi:hypothetical protein
MLLEKTVNVLRQLWPDAFRRRDLFDRRLPQPFHGTEPAQKQILAVLTHARTIVENAFADALLHQELVVGISESVGLVSNALE